MLDAFSTSTFLCPIFKYQPFSPLWWLLSPTNHFSPCLKHLISFLVSFLHSWEDVWPFASLCSGKRPCLETSPSRQRNHIKLLGHGHCCAWVSPLHTPRQGQQAQHTAVPNTSSSPLLKKKTLDVDTLDGFRTSNKTIIVCVSYSPMTQNPL